MRIKGKGQKFKTGKQHNRGSKKTPWSFWGPIMPGARGDAASVDYRMVTSRKDQVNFSQGGGKLYSLSFLWI